MSETRWTSYESPLGRLALGAGAAGLTGIAFRGGSRPAADAGLGPGRRGGGARGPLDEAVAQLDAYFAGELREFELPLAPAGSPLRREVWRQLLQVPYGSTVSYGELAERVEPSLFDPGTEPWQRARVVGAANRANPLAIVVPCHRVIGADGSLTGYAGGLHRKRALLELEGGPAAAPPSPHRRDQQLTILPPA